MLESLIAAYDGAMSRRAREEDWSVRRYADHFVLHGAMGDSPVDFRHTQTGNAIELESVLRAGDAEGLLHATEVIGPLRCGRDASGRLCLRGTYLQEQTPGNEESFAAGVIEACVRLHRASEFASESDSAEPLEIRLATSLTEQEEEPVTTEADVDDWLMELRQRFLLARRAEWRVQTFGAERFAYTWTLNMFDARLIGTSYGCLNPDILIDDETIELMLRLNHRSGLGKLILVTFTESGKRAPMATIEVPAASIRNRDDLGRLASSTTEYLEFLWKEFPAFFAPLRSSL